MILVPVKLSVNPNILPRVEVAYTKVTELLKVNVNLPVDLFITIVAVNAGIVAIFETSSVIRVDAL